MVPGNTPNRSSSRQLQLKVQSPQDYRACVGDWRKFTSAVGNLPRNVRSLRDESGSSTLVAEGTLKNAYLVSGLQTAAGKKNQCLHTSKIRCQLGTTGLNIKKSLVLKEFETVLAQDCH